MEVQEWVQLKEVNSNLRNKMTEKDYNPEQKNVKTMKKQQKAAEATTKKVVEDKKVEDKKEELKKQTESKKEVEKTPKSKDKKEEPKKPKKTEAIVRGENLPLSTKKAAAVCKFISGKEIEKVIEELEEVLSKKRAIPMKGEIPHRKGRGMMSGRYPIKTTEYFIKLLKSLNANSIANGLDSPVIITKAIANIGSRPMGRFGAHRKKRSHIFIEAKSKSKSNKTKSKKSKKEKK